MTGPTAALQGNLVQAGFQMTPSKQMVEDKLDEEKEIVILPHRIVRMSLKDYK